MSDDFGTCWRAVRLYAPLAPVFLIREWVNDAWKKLARSRHWSFLKGDLRLTTAVARTVTVTVTNGSSTVTSAGLFVAGDAGRTLRIATFPAYVIQSVPDVNTITLVENYGEDTAVGVSASIFDSHATLPADFESFRLVANPYLERRLAFWITEDQLNLLDPTRQVSDNSARALIPATPSPYTPLLGRVRYEYWPRPTAARSYPVIYNKQAARLSDTSIFSGVLADASDVLIAGALAEAALWPGTKDQPNPYYSVTTAREKKAQFYEGVQRLSLRDDDQSPDDLATVHWERWPLADLAYNDVALRATDATVSDLY